MKIIFLFLFPIIGYSQNNIISQYRGFDGGINNYTTSINLDANESPNLMNVVIDEPLGAITQRNGYSTCGTIPSGKTITNLYSFIKTNGDKWLIVTDNENIYATTDCSSFITIKTGLNANYMPRFATVLDKLWITNGANAVMTWDGSNLGYVNNAPIAKYIVYWKSRVWLGNETTNPSSVSFSALTDTSGNILAPDTDAAWISTNKIYINRDDGSQIYGMKVYRDNLYIFKETGISRIIFESDFNIAVNKNVTSIGSKYNESIVEGDDGILRYLGRDGVYAFDGYNIKRLSDKWVNIFKNIKQNNKTEGFKSWDTASDWINGTFVNLTTSSVPGSLILARGDTLKTIDDFSDGDYTNNPTWTILNGSHWRVADGQLESYCYNDCSYLDGISGSSDENIYTSMSNYSNFDLNYTTITFNMYNSMHNYQQYEWVETEFFFISDSPNGQNGYSIRISRTSDASRQYTVLYVNKYVGGVKTQLYSKSVEAYITPENFQIFIYIYPTYFHIDAGSFGVFEDINDASYRKTSYILFKAGAHLVTYDGRTATLGIDNISYPAIYKSSGTFTSEISNAVNISAWDGFSYIHNLNGGTINYYFRASDTIDGVSNSAWTSVNNGLIQVPTANYYQWKAEFKTSDLNKTPQLDSAIVKYLQGDLTKTTIYANNYKSRYWLSVSTANNYNDLTLVQSKSPLNSWTIFDLPINAYTYYNGHLYGALSNSGKIAILDYGTNDDGNAITSYYDTRDEMFQNPIAYKAINRAIIDLDSSLYNDSLKIGLSNDLGNTWSYKTIDTYDANYKRKTRVINFDANNSLQTRLRILNDKKDANYKIFGIYMLGNSTEFIGNK
jgi:hypothetical protein